MTATADIVAQQVKDVLQVPNAALRFTPPTTARRPNGTGLIGLILPRPPGPGAQGRTTSTAEGEGERKVYVLRNNAPVAVTITTGATDGTHTAVVSGDLKEGDKVIVGSRTSS
jgi:HlyD family secretion protein